MIFGHLLFKRFSGAQPRATDEEFHFLQCFGAAKFGGFRRREKDSRGRKDRGPSAVSSQIRSILAVSNVNENGHFKGRVFQAFIRSPRFIY
jgi:hypothetical protein